MIRGSSSLLKVEFWEAISIKTWKPKMKVHLHFFSFGKRYTNIIQTKLRHNHILNYDLCKRNILNSLECSCGKQENAYHFFFVCTNYSIPRNTLFDCLFKLELVNIDINLLLCGDVINNRIIAAVNKFIDESCRFS